MTAHRANVPERLERLADGVLLPCFDGTAAPEWVRRRVGESLGGVCLFARNVQSVDQVRALSAALAAERESVVVAVDEEAGDVTRLHAATGSPFPGAFALGRAGDVALTELIARQVGALLRYAGVSLNLAPCADVAIDPDNPVIGSRSFGRDPEVVARHTAAWVRGQQAAGVAACTKHFPGHGDTNADSHHTVTVLHGDWARLERDALPPFVAAIAAGSAAIMPGHLLVPAVDDLPATVSASWLTDILRGRLGFTGTIVTDALEMAGVADDYGIAGGAVRALIAGADLLCIGGETRPEAEIDGIRDAIVDAVLDGTLSEERLADAAARSRAVSLAAVRAGGGDADALPDDDGGPAVEVARRAAESTGPLPELAEPVLVLRCSDIPNIAVGVVPWGPAAVMSPPPAEIVLRAGDAFPAERARAAGSLLVVTRDRHRHPWMVDVLAAARAVNRDAILLEMGISVVTGDDAPAIASYGGTLANSRAVSELLHGAPITA